MQTTGFKSSASMKFGDRLFGALAKSFAWLTLILLAGIILALIYASWPSTQAFGIGFLFSDAWNPPMDEFGALIPIYGTLVTSVIALLIAVPAILAGLSWWLAGYFTLKRRMNLPSMVLVAAYAGGVHISALTILAQADLGGRAVLLIASVVTVAAVALVA